MHVATKALSQLTLERFCEYRLTKLLHYAWNLLKDLPSCSELFEQLFHFGYYSSLFSDRWDRDWEFEQIFAIDTCLSDKPMAHLLKCSAPLFSNEQPGYPR